jgi:hypothetical protein
VFYFTGRLLDIKEMYWLPWKCRLFSVVVFLKIAYFNTNHSSCVQDLGVWLDEGMNMQMHVKMMCKAANSSLYITR